MSKNKKVYIPNELDEIVTANLKRHMQDKGINQVALANLVGTKKENVSLMLNLKREIGVNMIFRLAKALDISFKMLIADISETDTKGSDFFNVLQTRIKGYNFGKLSDEEKIDAVDLIEILVAILTSDDNKGKKAIRENLEYFQIAVKRKGVIAENKLSDPANETDRASPSIPDKPKAKIQGG